MRCEGSSVIGHEDLPSVDCIDVSADNCLRKTKETRSRFGFSQTARAERVTSTTFRYFSSISCSCLMLGVIDIKGT
jgi:hypothetical protein